MNFIVENSTTRIAYYVPGLGWKQRSFKTQDALEQFLTEREGQYTEVRYLHRGW